MAKFIEFPIFTGVAGELRPWISWLEAFFVREKFTKLEKMNLAQSLLEGEAEAWFYRIQKTLIFYSWKELKDKLLLRFGDFTDSDRIRLIAEQDRFLQEIRDEARIQRMKTTSIPVKDTIRETITVVEETSEIVAGNLAERASEKKLVSQYQVPVSSLEPSLSFSSEPLDVSASWLCEVVSNNLVHSQSVLDCVKNKTNAYQVFDKTSSHKERLKPKTKRKLGLSLKTWMFKFKHTSNKRKSLDVKSFSVEEIAWLMRDSKEIYRSCVDKEFKAVVAGSKGLASDGCVILGMHCAGFGSGKTELLATGQQMQRTDLFSELLKDSSNGGAESFPILNVVTEHSFLWLQKTSENYLLVSEFEKKKQMLGYKTRMFKYKGIEDAVEIAQVTLLLQLILDDVKSHMRHKWKSTHLRAVYLRTTPSYALDVVNKPVTECKNVRVIATDLARQAVLDQITKGLEMKTKMKVLKSWMFKYKPATSSSMLPLYVYQLGVSDKEMVADPVTQSLLGTLLWSTSFKQQKFCKDWWFKFKYDIAGETRTDTHAYMSVHASTISRLQA